MQGLAQLGYRDRLRSRLAQLGKQAAVEEQGVQLLPQISPGSEVRPIFRQNLPGPLRGPVQRPEQLRGEVPLLLHGGPLFFGADDAAGLEVHVAQAVGESQDVPVGLRPAQGGAGEDVLHTVRLADPGPEAAHEQGGLHAGGPLVDVGLVQDNIAELGPPEHRVVLRAEHHVLQHGVVGDKDMGRCGLHGLPGDDLVGPGVGLEGAAVGLQGPGLDVLRVAVI